MTPVTDQTLASLKRAYVAFNEGEFDAAVAELHPDFEYRPAGGQTPILGRDSFRAWMQPDAFSWQRIAPLEVEAGNGHVLVHQHARMQGAGSGIEGELHTFAVWRIDPDGRPSGMAIFQAHEEREARRAAGLDER